MPRLRYCYAVNPTKEQRADVRGTELYSVGDAVLVWVNQGDLISLEMADIAVRLDDEPRPTASSS